MCRTFLNSDHDVFVFFSPSYRTLPCPVLDLSVRVYLLLVSSSSSSSVCILSSHWPDDGNQKTMDVCGVTPRARERSLCCYYCKVIVCVYHENDMNKYTFVLSQRTIFVSIERFIQEKVGGRSQYDFCLGMACDHGKVTIRLSMAN